MSAFQKATNFVFSKDFVKYIFSTHFWGPVSNFGIPLAAIMDLKKDPLLISGPMTGSLVVYSLVFMRYATQVRPWNPLLFGTHFINEGAQLTQGFRYLQYWYGSEGKEHQAAFEARQAALEAKTAVSNAASDAVDAAKKAAGKA